MDSLVLTPLQPHGCLIFGDVTHSTGPQALIDLSALSHNYREASRIVGSAVRVLAMVKANAYGHGAARVTARLSELGCTDFGVATLEEAEVVRAAAPDARCVVFGGVLPADASRIVDLDVGVATSNDEVIRAVAEYARASGRRVPVHVKVDSGMGRLGIEPEGACDLVELVDSTDGVTAAGVCSHFACAESVTGEVTKGQLEAMAGVAGRLGEHRSRLTFHLANSAAVMTRPETYFDMVRPGLMLYGLLPDPSLEGRAQLRRVMALRAPVIRVARIGVGKGISYGHTFHTQRDSRIATLRCGYADGYPRSLSNKGRVSIAGREAPIVGRVCMDHMMIDVTDAPEVAVGDWAELWGDANPTEAVAVEAETIPYELVARVGARPQRVYVGEE